MGINVMGVKGLGDLQIKERKKTDTKVLNFIKSNPACYTRQIIKDTSMSPNSVTASLKRLKSEKKIITHKESRFFRDVEVPSKAIAYVPNYGKEGIEKASRVRELKKEVDNFHKSIKEMWNLQFKQRKPNVIKWAEALHHLLKLGHSETIHEMQETLGIRDVNDSMIGFYIYKLYDKADKQNNGLPWVFGFYYRMLPRKYCEINIQSPSQLIDFIKKNFPHALDLRELIDNKFSCFNTRTKNAASMHITNFFTAEHKKWLSSHGFTN